LVDEKPGEGHDMKPHPRYRDVIERNGKFYVGDVSFSVSDPDFNAVELPDSLVEQLGLPPGCYLLRRCSSGVYGEGCGAPFIAGSRFSNACKVQRCSACRDKADHARIARWVAKRSMARENARLARPGITCAVCGKALAFMLDAHRSTKKYCSAACRQAAHRERSHNAPKP
jgi:hypothetical protein